MYISEKTSINIPFSFICAHRMADKNALLDSGATENFMDERLVEQLGIGRRRMKQPRRVFNVDGSENKHGTLTHYCLLRVKKGDKNQLQQFYITNLGSDRAILGYPWLRDFNPRINWKEGCVLGSKVTIETGLFQTAKKWRTIRIIEAAQQHLEWEDGDEVIASINLPTHVAQQWAIKANKGKQDLELPSEYHRHCEIFSEEGASRFPPARPDDLVIKLKPGAPETMNTKIYPMSRSELVVLRFSPCTIRCDDLGPGWAFGYFPPVSRNLVVSLVS
jgi:hypothetical protein